MSAKKIDQLFRNKLQDHGVAPSQEAWAKLQGKMKAGSKLPVYWMQIAAAVLLLLTAGWFLINYDDSRLKDDNLVELEAQPAPVPSLQEKEPAPVVPEIDQDALLANHETTAKEKSSPEKQQKAAVKKVIVNTKNSVETNHVSLEKELPLAFEEMQKLEEEVKEIAVPEAIEPLEMDKQIAAASDTVVPVKEVKITYIADGEDRFLEPVRELLNSDSPKEKKNGLNKLITSARQITSGDILADIRASKDELFNGSIRLGKDEKVNNSK